MRFICTNEKSRENGRRNNFILFSRINGRLLDFLAFRFKIYLIRAFYRTNCRSPSFDHLKKSKRKQKSRRDSASARFQGADIKAKNCFNSVPSFNSFLKRVLCHPATITFNNHFEVLVRKKKTKQKLHRQCQRRPDKVIAVPPRKKQQLPLPPESVGGAKRHAKFARAPTRLAMVNGLAADALPWVGVIGATPTESHPVLHSLTGRSSSQRSQPRNPQTHQPQLQLLGPQVT